MGNRNNVVILKLWGFPFEMCFRFSDFLLKDDCCKIQETRSEIDQSATSSSFLKHLKHTTKVNPQSP